MKELTYPFDGREIISNKVKFKKCLRAIPGERIKKKIAILGGSTTNDIKNSIELFLLNEGIEPTFFESEYNQYYQEAIFPSKELLDFQPDIIYVYTTIRNIKIFPVITQSVEEVEALISAEKEKYIQIWENLERVFHCPIIQNNFEMPMIRLLGNRDVSDIHGTVNYINRLNLFISQYAQEHNGFYVCDINYLSATYGLDRWYDLSYWYMYKYAMALYAIPEVAFQVANIIKSLFGKNKKGLILDLDNTLWGGVISEDGLEKIEIGQEEATAQAYWEFQKYIKDLKGLGVVLNVNSKNDRSIALEGLNHPDGMLRPDDFIVIKANWEPKNKNHEQIALELSLTPESLVFIDDNPAERKIVTDQIPGVAAPCMDRVENYIKTLDRSGFFEVTTFSTDDIKRNQMYRENVMRKEREGGFESYEDYLKSLEMEAKIQSFDKQNLPRITQLTNKSNQFNLTTRRYTLDELSVFLENPNYITLYARLIDCFGDNGIVSAVIGKIEQDACHIVLWLMSCRVLKRNLECAVMDKMVQICKKRRINRIIGYYYPTKKNKMVKFFYDECGFTKKQEDDAGATTWVLNVDDYRKQNNVIVVEDIMEVKDND